MSASWKVTLPATKAEAEAIAAAEIDGAVLVTTEEDEAAERWRLDAYFEGEPDAGTLAAVRGLVADPVGEPAPLPDEDWLVLSQAGLEPIEEGRFRVTTGTAPLPMRLHGCDFVIPAGQAFGTGHHETTAGCLAMLDGLEDEAVANWIELGTGTGVLAFAARHLWPLARATATDIDPVAITVTRENMAVNHIDALELLVADGARDPAIAGAAPYDLVIANILAGPLIAMAGEIGEIVAPHALVLLAGLLTRQARDVLSAYQAVGCVEERRIERGDWTILLLRAGAIPIAMPEVGDGRGDWALDR